jgi:hypothetical protein
MNYRKVNAIMCHTPNRNSRMTKLELFTVAVISKQITRKEDGGEFYVPHTYSLLTSPSWSCVNHSLGSSVLRQRLFRSGHCKYGLKSIHCSFKLFVGRSLFGTQNQDEAAWALCTGRTGHLQCLAIFVTFCMFQLPYILISDEFTLVYIPFLWQ